MSKSPDINWKHFITVDDNKKIKCKWCGKIVSGGICRGKKHLAGIISNIKICTAVPIKMVDGDDREEMSFFIGSN